MFCFVEAAWSQYLYSESAQALGPFAPFSRIESINIPDTVYEQYNQTECKTQMGLFSEIDRVWITVDNRLYFWNYHGGQDLHTFDELDRPITAVALVPPKKGMFIDAINHLLVLVTVTDLYIIALSYNKDQNSLELYETGMTISVRGLDISQITSSSKSGRIFMSGESDGTNLWEVFYSNVESWFKGKCSKVCHTRQYLLSSITPTFPSSDIGVLEKLPVIGSWVKNHESEVIVSIVIDDSRNLLYTLSNLSTIRMYYLDPKKNTDASLLYTYTTNQLVSHLKMIPIPQDQQQPKTNTNPKTFSLASISAVTADESSLLNLVAITSTGTRIFIKAANTSYEAGPPTTMQAIQQRFPPTNASQNACILKDTKRTSRVFTPGYFFDVVPCENPDHGDRLFVAAPDSGKIIHQMTPGLSTQYFENACFLEIEGYVHDMSLVSSLPLGSSGKRVPGFGNESRDQYTIPNPKIAVLTNTGVQVFARKYPYQIFKESGQDIRPFFEFYGRTETCANALSIATQPALFSFTETEFASKVYIELGGKPHLKVDDENTYSLTTSTTKTPGSDSIINPATSGITGNFAGQTGSAGDMIRLSGRFDGLATYLSRVVWPIWGRSPFLTKTVGSGPKATHSFYINYQKKSLETIQVTLAQIADYLDKNKTFIDGLSGEPNMSNLVISGGRSEEVSLQAEHRALYSLVKLVTSVREGLSFLLLLLDESAKSNEGLESIAKYLPQPIRQKLESLTFKSFFTTAEGSDLAKELITCLVNRNVSEGGSVDNICVILQNRCVSYCSPNDVIIYKALECLHKAEGLDMDSRLQKLGESLKLFQQAAGSIQFDVLKEAIAQFVKLKFYSGAVELALSVAQQEDRGNVAVGYLHDDKPDPDPRKEIYEKRQRVYELIFEVLDVIDTLANDEAKASAGSSGSFAPNNKAVTEQKLKNDTYAVCQASTDEVFHYSFYDWIVSHGHSDRLLSVKTPYIQRYLELQARSSINFANLLWYFYQIQGKYIRAAEVLYDLARSSFRLTLSQRIEYLSRAKNFCSSATGTNDPQSGHALRLGTQIEDHLQIAVVQDELVKRIIDDSLVEEQASVMIERLSGQQERSIDGSLVDGVVATTNSVGGQILDISVLFQDYAVKLGYHDLCLEMIYIADYRGADEISNTWSKLISSEHEKAVADAEEFGESYNNRNGSLANGAVAPPYDSISAVVQSVGKKVQLAEFVFPVETLVAKLEEYTVEYSPGAPRGWVVETFLGCGVSFDALATIFRDLVERHEYPFDSEVAYKRLADDTVYLLEKWSKETRGGYEMKRHGIVTLELIETIEKALGSKDKTVEIRSALGYTVTNGTKAPSSFGSSKVSGLGSGRFANPASTGLFSSKPDGLLGTPSNGAFGGSSLSKSSGGIFF